MEQSLGEHRGVRYMETKKKLSLMPAYPVVSETKMTTTTTETLGWFARFRWYRASLSVVEFFGVGLGFGVGDA